VKKAAAAMAHHCSIPSRLISHRRPEVVGVENGRDYADDELLERLPGRPAESIQFIVLKESAISGMVQCDKCSADEQRCEPWKPFQIAAQEVSG
jgi:hypothetical protein